MRTLWLNQPLMMKESMKICTRKVVSLMKVSVKNILISFLCNLSSDQLPIQKRRHKSSFGRAHSVPVDTVSAPLEEVKNSPIRYSLQGNLDSPRYTTPRQCTQLRTIDPNNYIISRVARDRPSTPMSGAESDNIQSTC